MTILERKAFISSNPRIVLSSCPPPCGHFSIQESATGGLSYKVRKIPYRIPPATSMIPVEPQKEGNTISYFSSYSISAINLVTTIDKKLVTVRENKRVYVIIHTRSSRLCLLPPVLSQRYITPRSNTIPRSIGPVHTTPAYP